MLLFHIFWIKQTMLKEVFWLELVQRPSSCRKIRTVCRPKGTCLKTRRFLYIPINFKVKRAESMSAFPLGFEHSPAAAPGHAASASNSGKGNVRCVGGSWRHHLGCGAEIQPGAPSALQHPSLWVHPWPRVLKHPSCKWASSPLDASLEGRNAGSVCQAAGEDMLHGRQLKRTGQASLPQHCCLMRLKAPRAQQPKCSTSVAGSKVP